MNKVLPESIRKIISAAGLLQEFDHAIKHQGEFHLKVTPPKDACFMPLVIEVVWGGKISVCHYFMQNGDVMYDPEIVCVQTSADPHAWGMVSFTQHSLGYYREWPEPQNDSFMTLWGGNLADQGYIEWTREGRWESLTHETVALQAGIEMERSVERYAYINTRSGAGRPEKVTFPADSILWVRKWTNLNGNPSYTIQLSDGRLLYLVDDFTGTSEFPCRTDYVKTRKALFTGTPHAL